MKRELKNLRGHIDFIMIAIIFTTKLLFVLVLADLAGHQEQTGCPADQENFEKGDPQKVGDDVILPCVAKFSINVENDNVEWSKGNKEIYIIKGMHAGEYKDRAHVSIDELKKRNASLKLFNVNDADEGKYCCCILTDQNRKCIDVTLVMENLTENDKKKKSSSPNGNDNSAAEEPEVIGSHEPIGAVAGEDVILPCHLEPPFDVTTLRVEWKFNESFVHVYRSRMDDTALQDKKFKNRTFLFHNEMHTGNISLKLTKVSLTDAGKYTCYVPKLQSQVKRGYINLIVDSMDEGKKRQQEATTEAPKNNQTTQHNVQYTGTIIAVVLGVVVLLVIIAVAIRQKQRMCSTQDKDGHNRSNTVNTQEQVPLNTTNNTNNTDNADNVDNVDNTEHVDNEDNAVNAENTNESGQH